MPALLCHYFDLHLKGLYTNGWFYGENLLEELDTEGEYYGIHVESTVDVGTDVYKKEQ